jgi:hypothetical protein
MGYGTCINGVEQAARLEFFKKNPVVAKAWKVEV